MVPKGLSRRFKNSKIPAKTHYQNIILGDRYLSGGDYAMPC